MITALLLALLAYPANSPTVIRADKKQHSQYCNNAILGSERLEAAFLDGPAARISDDYFRGTVEIFFCLKEGVSDGFAHIIGLNDKVFVIYIDKRFFSVLKRESSRYGAAFVSHELAHIKAAEMPACISASEHRGFDDRAECEIAADKMASLWSSREAQAELLKVCIAYAGKLASGSVSARDESRRINERRLAILESK